MIKLLMICALSTAAAFSLLADETAKQTPKKEKTDPRITVSDSEAQLMKKIGAKFNQKGEIVIDDAIIHKDKSISFTGYINIRQGPIEVLISGPKGRTHESLIISQLDPFKLQLALILAGFRNGPMIEDSPIPMGTVFDIEADLGDGKRINLDQWLTNVRENAPKGLDGYVFIGSNFQEGKCLASLEGNLVNINSGDQNTILNSRFLKQRMNDQYDAVSEKLPPPKKSDKPEPAIEDYYVNVTVFLVPRKDQPGDRKKVSNPPVPPKNEPAKAQTEEPPKTVPASKESAN